jgi:hypothetical protein
MGDGVNIAARLEGVCEPGAICLSEDAYRQVSGRLDMAVTDLGPTQLKNIERSIRVYSLQVGVPAQAKPATEAKPAEPKKPSRLALLSAGIATLIVIWRAPGISSARTGRPQPRTSPSSRCRSPICRAIRRRIISPTESLKT